MKEITYMRSVQKKRLHEIHSFGWKWQREKRSGKNLIYLDGKRETTTDLYCRYVNLKVCFLGFVNKIISIRKDSISISWFWSDQQDSTTPFRSVWRFCLIAQNVCIPSGLRGSFLSKNAYLWPLKNVGLSLTAASNWLSPKCLSFSNSGF